MECFIHTAVYLGHTERKGRGMFCRDSIAEGTIIEVAPIIRMNAEERMHLQRTLLHDYIFGWEGDDCCVALGYGCIYNHAYTANCNYEKNYTARTFIVRTVRPIAAGEELTINYNGVWNHQGPLWFAAE